MRRENVKEGTPKDYAHRVQEAMVDLRKGTYHSFYVKVTRMEILEAAKKYRVSFFKLENLTRVIEEC